MAFTGSNGVFPTNRIYSFSGSPAASGARSEGSQQKPAPAASEYKLAPALVAHRPPAAEPWPLQFVCGSEVSQLLLEPDARCQPRGAWRRGFEGYQPLPTPCPKGAAEPGSRIPALKLLRFMLCRNRPLEQ